jgi:hypothetical protein
MGRSEKENDEDDDEDRCTMKEGTLRMARSRRSGYKRLVLPNIDARLD